MASSNPGNPRTKVVKSEEEWKEELSRDEYRILRLKGFVGGGGGGGDGGGGGSGSGSGGGEMKR